MDVSWPMLGKTEDTNISPTNLTGKLSMQEPFLLRSCPFSKVLILWATHENSHNLPKMNNMGKNQNKWI